MRKLNLQLLMEPVEMLVYKNALALCAKIRTFPNPEEN